MEHIYRLIFGGKHIKEIRVDPVDDEYINELRELEEDDIISSVLDLYADQLHIYGISRDHGYIRVYEHQDNDDEYTAFEDLGEPLFILHPGELPIEHLAHEPEQPLLIAAYVNNQDGVLGHIDLKLDEVFDPNKLTLVETSAEVYGGEEAIDQIQYETSNGAIIENINIDAYLSTTSKVEIAWVSEIDEEKNELPIYEDSEWLR